MSPAGSRAGAGAKRRRAAVTIRASQPDRNSIDISSMQQDAALNLPNGESGRRHNQIGTPGISIFVDISYFLLIFADAGRIKRGLSTQDARLVTKCVKIGAPT
jgi:hypothetical protein